MCWGEGGYGRLGHGSSSDEYNPVYVNSSESFTSVSAGGRHTCGRLVNGSLMCWGQNNDGGVGDGTTSNRYNPVYVNSSENFISFSAGYYHTCGVLVNGDLKCWGSNDYCEISLEYYPRKIKPVYIDSSENFISVEASSQPNSIGGRTCGILVNNSLMCWGANYLGNGGNQGAHSPVYVSSSENFTSISTGQSHTCGFLVNGSLMCWGANNYGQVGDGTETNKYSPVYVDTTETFVNISAGTSHTCGVLTNGSVMCWGYNYYGQLGNGTAGSGQEAHSPIYVNSSETFSDISAGSYHTCGVLTNGGVMCWGEGNNYQLGHGGTSDKYSPYPVDSAENFTSVSAGFVHTCGRLVNGSLMCWGEGSNYRLGYGGTSDKYSPYPVDSAENFISVSAGYQHTCGRLVNGSVMCWGDNDYAQLGDNTLEDKSVTMIYSSQNFNSVSARGQHSCGSLINGSVMCWGYDNQGQIGDGFSDDYKVTPTSIYYEYSPFLYVFRDGKYEFVSDFISGATSQDKEYTSFSDITDKFEVVDGKVKLKITEEMDETAYIDRVYLRVDSGLESERIIELSSITNADIELLRYSDDDYLVMEKGAEHYIEFNAPESYSKIEFASEGYYIQHSDYSGMQERTGSFSSVPTPVSYVSHNSVHTDYIKLEVPAMGTFTVSINTQPTITANATSPATVYTNTDFNLNLTITDPNADQTLTGYVQFYVNNTANGSVQSQTAANGTNTLIGTLGSGNFSKDYNLIAEFWAGDGTDNTTKENTTQVTVQNSAPTIPTLTNPANQSIQSTVDVTINWSSTDADSDTITYYIYFLNTTPITYNSSTQNLYKSYTNLADSQTYYWKIIAGDGTDNSTESETRQFIIDISTPTYSDNSTSSTSAGQPIEHRLKWTDNVGLSGYIFQFCNGTWNKTHCGGETYSENWADSNCNYRSLLTFDNSVSSENLINFPVIVKLNSSRISYTKTSATDIRFYDNDNLTLLSKETELWNNSGDSFVWVKVPLLENTTNDFIWAYYDCANTNSDDATNVWDSDYKAVWHMTEVNATDSTSNNNNGTESGGVAYTDLGKIDGADDFDGDNDYINCSNGSSLNSISDNITITAWIYPKGWGEYAASGYGRIVDKGKFLLFINRDGQPAYNNYSLVGYIYLNNGSAYPFNTPIDSISLNTWQHVAATYDNNSVKIYINGKSQDLSYMYGPPPWDVIGDHSANELLIGESAAQNRAFNGTIDDVRISNISRSASWINASYLSGSDKFITYENEESKLTGGGWNNDSWVAFSTNPDWSNVTKTVNSTVGATIAWCVYANDTSNKWNKTSCENPFSYITTAAPTIIAHVTKPDIVYTNTDWMLNLTIVDLDNITIIAYTQFYVNGIASGSEHFLVVSNNTNTNVANLSSSSFNKGAKLIAEFWAGDGTVNTTKENTSTVTVQPLNLQLFNITTDSSSYYQDDTATFISYVNGSLTGALLIDDSPGFENCNYTERTGCIAYSDNVSLTASPQQLNATMATSSSTTWYAQVCDDDGSCDSLISYDFTDLTNKNAYEKLGVPSSPDDYDSEATSADYANIVSSNNNRWITALATENGEFDTQIFKFNLSEDISQISSLNITWEGYGDPISGYYTNVSLWNWTSETWYELTKKDFASQADDTLNGVISSGTSDFVHSSTNHVVIKVTSRKYILKFSSISLGEYHTCGVLTNGSAMCWGANWDGMLGDGTTTDKFSPVFINSTESFSSVSAGYEYSCGRLVNGSIMCWGNNDWGQLGDGTSGNERHSPVYVNSSENFTSVSAGGWHTCGRLINGSLMCWGYNGDGVIGDGTTTHRYNPNYINSSENFTSVSAGYIHTCGRLINGSLMCWGENWAGQLGNGTTGSDMPYPLYVNSSGNFTSVSAGSSHTCGRLINGSLMCWGNNWDGRLGDGTTTDRYNPTYINSSKNFSSVSTGNGDYGPTCGVLINGSAMCWGYNYYGGIGDGTNTNRHNPTYVNSNENFSSVFAGSEHTCGILVNGNAMCWGYNWYGEIGDGTTGYEINPVPVDSSENFSSASAGGWHTCGRLVNGSLMCWGYNGAGQVGDGTEDIDRPNPIYVNSSKNFSSVDAGIYHTCGVLTNGSVMCWGSGSSGRLGDGYATQRNNPVYVNSSEIFSSVSGGYRHTCSRLVNGSLMCWGDNSDGQLGNGTRSSGEEAHNPIYINSSENFTSVSAGISLNYRFTCGMLINGSLMCWGDNHYGQMGDGTSGNYRPNPVYINSNENFTSVSAGNRHACGRLVNGSLMCWGNSGSGQLGDGYTNTRTSPVYVNSSENFTSVSTGSSHTCGRLVNGSLMCWGYNGDGVIGDGTTTNRLNPVYVNSSENFTSVSAGYSYTCGRLINGSLMCWGDNYNGGIGIGYSSFKYSPVYVVYQYSPFLYVFRDGKYEFVSDFIAGATSPEMEYTSFIDITSITDIVDGKVRES